VELKGENIATNGTGLDIIGGSSVVRGLAIDRFNLAGIHLATGGSNSVMGNFILGNGIGVQIENSANNGIGCTTPDERNLISANTGDGVEIMGTSANGNLVQGNLIGTDVTGTQITFNSLPTGNGGAGIDIYDGSNNIVGNSALAGTPVSTEGNVIGGNGADGIEISSGTSGGVGSNGVAGNFIGTDRTGTLDLANSGDGIHLGGDTQNNYIGGTSSNLANIIAHNAGVGVSVNSAAMLGHVKKNQQPAQAGDPVNNTIRGNSIHDNGGLGIDLGSVGVTPNDDQDTDTGANQLQNFPVITSATATSTNTITGTLNSTPGQAFTIDFYANASCDTSGNGEGQTYLGSLTTDPTDGNGDVSLTSNPTTLASGDVITATATDASGNTSEFSQCFSTTAGTAGQIEFTMTNYTVTEGPGSVMAQITVNRVGGSDGMITATFDTSDGTAQAGEDYTAVNGYTVTYNDGQTGQQTIDIPILDNNLYEEDETVNLSLSTTTVNHRRPTSAPTINPLAAVLTITDDESKPTISINDAFVAEPISGTSQAAFTITLSNPAEAPVTFNLETADNTATAPADYIAIANTPLTFNSGDTSIQVNVFVNADNVQEVPPETFFVNLSNPSSNATIAA